jgi:type I restriction enzyme, S subunit
VEHELRRFLTESRVLGNDGSVAKKLTVKLWGNGVFEKVETIKGSASTQYYKRKAGQFIYSKLDFLNQAFGVIPNYLDGFESTVDLPCFDVGRDLNPRFLLEYVQRKDFYKRFGEIADGGRKAKRIQVESFLSFPITVPEETEEQQKIADCLTSLDEVITGQGRKVEALKAQKRGLMQKLFPREGETLPRLRFPEFCDGQAWEKIAIGDMGEIITGNTPATSRREYYGGEHLFVSPADMSDLRFVGSTKTTLSDAGFAQSRSIKAGSVLFVCIGSTIGKVAQNARECSTNQQINSVVASSSFSADFIYYLLHMASERIAKLAGKQAVPIINKTLFSSVMVVVPRLCEQNRIVDCLSSLDAKIAAESQKFNALKTHKQGLMQQLFPPPEETL